MSPQAGLRVRVKGIVQGVGFRPFVYNLAQRLALRGWVRNTNEGVDEHRVRFLDRFLVPCRGHVEECCIEHRHHCDDEHEITEPCCGSINDIDDIADMRYFGERNAGGKDEHCGNRPTKK